MIDVLTETILTPGEAAKLLPSSRPGKKLHVATLHRCFSDGRLEFVRLGGRIFTSREAIERLVRRESQRVQRPVAAGPAPRTPSARARKAMAELSRRGI